MVNRITNCYIKGFPVKVEQFVMAYGAEHDRIRALMPNGYESLRPVIRINAEIRDGSTAYVEANTAVASAGKKGWLNIAAFEDVTFEKDGNTTTFKNDQLEITFTRVGIQGGCPAEKDNDGCFYLKLDHWHFIPAEIIDVNKEFCECRFKWLTRNGTEGESVGETLPAVPEDVKKEYPHKELSIYYAAQIPCRQVLGAYAVEFER